MLNISTHLINPRLTFIDILQIFCCNTLNITLLRSKQFQLRNLSSKTYKVT